MNDELNKLKTRLLRAGLKKEALQINKFIKLSYQGDLPAEEPASEPASEPVEEQKQEQEKLTIKDKEGVLRYTESQVEGLFNSLKRQIAHQGWSLKDAIKNLKQYDLNKEKENDLIIRLTAVEPVDEWGNPTKPQRGPATTPTPKATSNPSSISVPPVSYKRYDTSKTTNIELGDKSPAVKRVQDYLVQKGYLARGQNDSAFGPNTYRAIVLATGSESLAPTLNADKVIDQIGNEVYSGVPIGSSKRKGRGSFRRQNKNKVDLNEFSWISTN